MRGVLIIFVLIAAFGLLAAYSIEQSALESRANLDAPQATPTTRVAAEPAEELESDSIWLASADPDALATP